MQRSRGGVWVLVALAAVVVGSRGICRAEALPVRADNGTIVLSLTLPPGWELVASPRWRGGSGVRDWAPADKVCLWGIPIGQNGGGNSLVNRSTGASAAAVTLGVAGSAEEAFRSLRELLPEAAPSEVPLSGAIQGELNTRGLRYAAFRTDGEPTILVLGRPGEVWIALLMIAETDRAAETALESLLTQR